MDLQEKTIKVVEFTSTTDDSGTLCVIDGELDDAMVNLIAQKIRCSYLLGEFKNEHEITYNIAKELCEKGIAKVFAAEGLVQFTMVSQVPFLDKENPYYKVYNKDTGVQSDPKELSYKLMVMLGEIQNELKRGGEPVSLKEIDMLYSIASELNNN